MSTPTESNKSIRKRYPLFLAMFNLIFIALLAVGNAGGTGLVDVVAARPVGMQVEPNAGSWRTWVLESGSQLRPATPPGRQDTAGEVEILKDLAEQRNDVVMRKIAYWNTGAPAYRWNEIAVNEMLDRGMNSMMAGRALALIQAAVYDATVATWDAKYTYNRKRPSEFDRTFKPVVETPNSPSYPAEHASAAGAASEVLAYLFPDKADAFRGKAAEAGEAFLYAGTQYPSDVETGLDLGRQVAALVIERAKTDNSDAQWDGQMPTGPGYWTGTNPALPMAGTWKTFVLASGDELRPAPPPAFDSAELAAEMDELRAFQRTPRTNTLALFWEYGAGGTRNYSFWNDHLSKKLLEYQLSDNAPRAARAYALLNITYYDSMVACWDAKYTYWALRPVHYDPSFQPLFNTPGHPSYPSAHSCLSGASAEVLGYLFPNDAEMFSTQAKAAGEARIWGGIHFRSDIVAGEAIAEGVAQKVIDIAQQDGSQ